MIKATDLRIGNIIELHGRNILIEGIAMDFINPSYSGKELFFDGLINEANGIQLTEEWVIKLGFEKINRVDGCFYLNDGIPMTGNNEKGFRLLSPFLKHEVQLKYVHQLQNLFFALTGQELIIKEEITA